MATAPTESWIERAARLRPGHVAVDAPDGTLTYRELDAASARVAHGLLARGLRREDEVAIALEAGAAFAIALHACLRAALVAVPVDGRLPAEQQARRTQECVARVDPASLSALLAAGKTPGAVPTSDETSGSGIATSRAGTAGQDDRDARGERAEPSEAAPAGRPIAGSGPDAATPAVRITTSGTTGPGTPVHLGRGALLWNALGSAAALGQPPHERWLSAMPVAHVGGLTVLVRSAIAATTALVRPRFDLAEQVAMLQAGEATITSVVPTTLRRLLDAGLDHPPNLRLVLLGGAPIPPDLLARAEAAGVPVASTYGLSEACSQVLTRGRPLFPTRVRLHEETGEVLVQGPTLATGVAGPDGWLATGDRGRRRTDGSFEIVGRIAETIVTGGENVAPTEIEAQLTAQPGIADAAALGVPHPEWGEQVEARVVLASGVTLDEPGLQAAVRAELPGFAVPKRIVAVASLPRTPTGKLIRRELR